MGPTRPCPPGLSAGNRISCVFIKNNKKSLKKELSPGQFFFWKILEKSHKMGTFRHFDIFLSGLTKLRKRDIFSNRCNKSVINYGYKCNFYKNIEPILIMYILSGVRGDKNELQY